MSVGEYEYGVDDGALAGAGATPYPERAYIEDCGWAPVYGCVGKARKSL
jgi:hypothetical protein